MKTFELSGEVRKDFGKKAAKAFRKENFIPCVVYGGHDKENIHFNVKEGDVRGIIYTPEVFLISLTLGNKNLMAILKDVQFHPVKEQILHIDFLHIFEGKPVEIAVPVRLEGLAIGVKNGGKLSLDKRKLRVKATYDKLPEELVINVSKLTIGKSIQVGELNFDDLEMLDAKNSVVCRVALTRAARGLAAGESEEDGEENEGGEENAETQE